mgnify:FL=1
MALGVKKSHNATRLVYALSERELGDLQREMAMSREWMRARLRAAKASINPATDHCDGGDVAHTSGRTLRAPSSG